MILERQHLARDSAPEKKKKGRARDARDAPQEVRRLSLTVTPDAAQTGNKLRFKNSLFQIKKMFKKKNYYYF